MRTCKVKGCDKKYHGKGYCKLHLYRILKKGNAENICSCGNIIGFHKQKCGKCKDKIYEEKKKRIRGEYIAIPMFCRRGTKGAKQKVYTNGVTEEIKPLIPKIRDKVLKDCIKNPRKYLED